MNTAFVRCSELPEQIYPRCNIVIYICPTEDCGNFYAAPVFRTDRSELEQIQSARSYDGTRVESHTRLECPDCRDNGIRVRRVPYVVTAIVSLENMMKAILDRTIREEVASGSG